MVQLELALVLPGQGVLGFDQDADESFFVEMGDRSHHGETTDELGNEPELHQVLGQDMTEELGVVPFGGFAHFGPEAHALATDAVLDDGVHAGKGAAADEEDVGGVDLNEFLMGVLAPPLWRYRRRGALQDLEQSLLDAFAGNVTGDRRVLRFASDLVDLVDVDDACLRPLHVVVGSLDELEEDVLDVLAHVTGLGESGGVGNGERNVEHAGQGLGQKGLAAPGGPQQQDVGLGQLDVVVVGAVAAGLHSLVVVVHGHRQDLFGVLLPDHVVVQELVDLPRLG